MRRRLGRACTAESRGGEYQHQPDAVGPLSPLVDPTALTSRQRLGQIVTTRVWLQAAVGASGWPCWSRSSPVSHVAARLAVNHVVEGVESLDAELEPEPLFQGACPEDRGIHLPVRIGPQAIAPQIAIGVLGGYLERSGIGPTFGSSASGYLVMLFVRTLLAASNV